jgi:hypothetical protein
LSSQDVDSIRVEDFFMSSHDDDDFCVNSMHVGDEINLNV